jgi:hypothetical protein
VHYTQLLIASCIETPGFIRATRYVNNEPTPGKGKFVAAYEIETNDIDEFLKANNENLARKRAAGRFTDLLVIVSRSLCRQTSALAR